MLGGELQWGRRENFSDGFQSDGLKAPVLVQVQLLGEAGRLAMRHIDGVVHRRRAIGLAVLRRLHGADRRTGAGRRCRRPSTRPSAKFSDLKEGKNADYIPALAKVDPNLFGIVLVTVDGKVYTAGDVKTEVSIQSISKVFTMAQVIQEQGLDSVEKQIGVDATGARFNSIIAIEGVANRRRHRRARDEPARQPRRDLGDEHGAGRDRRRSVEEDHRLPQRRGRPELTVLQDVYKSESDTNQRNQAIGALMFAYGYIKTNWQQAVDLYTRQCSIGVNARDLATMAATLAAGGKNPVTGKQVMDATKVPGVLAVMATAGLYDDSGKWLYHTGLPAKSGVGGGIIAVSPGSSASPSCRRRSTTPATACVRSARSPTFRTRLAAIRTRRGAAER